MSLSKSTLLLYQCSNYRDKSSEFSIKWDDKDLNIKWPRINKKILSNKDSAGISLKDFFNKIK
jgi:dTDP-4-dehydrorhamnose 3,5-epimerase